MTVNKERKEKKGGLMKDRQKKKKKCFPEKYCKCKLNKKKQKMHLYNKFIVSHNNAPNLKGHCLTTKKKKKFSRDPTFFFTLFNFIVYHNEDYLKK